MNEILKLKWNNHSSIFSQTLDSLRLKELYCDATLVCEAKYYPVHQLVLSTCSEYFEEIFSRTMCKHPFIILKDIQSAELEALLSYMYKGEVNVIQNSICLLISAAEFLRIKGLAVDENLPALVTESQAPLKNKHRRASRACSLSENNISEPKQSSQEGSDFGNEDSSQSSDARVLAEEEPNSIHNEKHELELQETEIEEIKKELDEADGLNENFDLTQNAVDDAHLFVSLFNVEGKDRQYDSASNASVPQCSSWNDNQVNEETISKEVISSDWLDASYYDSLPMDNLHFLSSECGKSSISPSDGPNGSSSTVKKQRNKNSNNKKGSKYECTECEFTSKDKSAFRLHIMRRHTGEKPFKCTLCTYRCTTNDMLKIHTRRHTGEKPFSCPYCSLSTAVKTSLKRHILIKHIQPKSGGSSGTPQVKPTKIYRCSYCSYQSRMKSNLNLHCMRIHTGEKPIACTLCPYRTTTKPQLEKHMRRHTGEKPFECSFCPYKGAQKQNLLKHMSVHTK